MAEIVMYKTTYCPYCVKAKELFKRKGITDIKEIDVTTSDDLRAEMLQKSGGRKTVPQIFINGQHIGGCDDAYALDAAGKLDGMLQG